MNNELKMIKILNAPRKAALSLMVMSDLNEAKIVHLLNTYNLALANSNHEYFQLLAKSEFNFVDGKLLKITLSKIFRVRIFQNRGIDLMRSILTSSPNGVNHLFICSNEFISERLTKIVAKEYPHLNGYLVVPQFSDNIEALAQEISDKISNRRFDYIWVGIGTPKQDFLAQELSSFYPGSFIVCVGAALDFLAGTKKEAPRILQEMGLEWLFRFLQEPRRLFKRYFIDSWGFVAIILRRKIEIEAR